MVKLAAVQFRPEKGNWHRSADALCRLIREAGERGAGLIVCPEMALTGYLFPDARAAASVAETLSGPTFARLSPLCQGLGCHLVIGYLERDEADAARLYNSALLIGPDGQLLHNYRKRLLYDCDKTWALPGDLPYPLLETPLGRLSAGICMDLNDDRFTAFLRREQPDLVAFCTNWIHEGMDILPYWRHRLRGVHSYFVAADTYGKEEAPPLHAHFLGRSAILDPAGRVLGLLPETGDGVLVAEA